MKDKETKSFINKDAFEPNSKIVDSQEFFKNIDERLEPYIQKWQLKETYFGEEVNIPGHTNSRFEPVKYFEVIKKENEAFSEYGERDNEICLTLMAQWPGYDWECEVNLFIRGKDVLNPKSKKISAEIIKTGGASMSVEWNNQLITRFTEGDWFFTRNVDKVWIDDMRVYS